METKSTNIVWHPAKVTKSDRQRLNQHGSCVIWFTGLSGAGKSTLANEVEKELYSKQIRSYVLDGDNIRHGLNRNLGFGQDDRKENIRRIGEVSKLFVDAGLFVLSAFISPYQEDRDQVRAMFEQGEFIEVYVKCDIQECEKRDPKGLYKKAKAGEIKNFTGVSAPYDPPVNPELVIETDKYSLEECVYRVVKYLFDRQYLPHEYEFSQSVI